MSCSLSGWTKLSASRVPDPTFSPRFQSATADIAQEPAATQFEVTLLLPTQDFVDVAHISQPRQPNAEGFLELPIPVAPTDAVQELRGLITESPEGFWLGAFGFVPVIAQEIVAELKEGEEKVYGPWVALVPPPVDPKATIPDPKAWKFTTEGVLGEFCELSAVFGDETPEGQKRGLKVVPSAFLLAFFFFARKQCRME